MSDLKRLEILELLIGTLTGFKSVADFHNSLFDKITGALKSNDLHTESFLFISGLMCCLIVNKNENGTYLYRVVNHKEKVIENTIHEFKNLIENETINLQCTQSFDLNISNTQEIHQMCNVVQGVLCSVVEKYIQKIFLD